jgi:hypothetical protein
MAEIFHVGPFSKKTPVLAGGRAIAAKCYNLSPEASGKKLSIGELTTNTYELHERTE